MYPQVAFLQPTEPSVELELVDEGLSKEAVEEELEVTLDDEADARNPRYLLMLFLSTLHCSVSLVMHFYLHQESPIDFHPVWIRPFHDIQSCHEQ